MITFIHEQGWDINDQACDSTTALDIAAVKGHLLVIQYLVETAGATGHVSAMIWAARNGHMDIVKYFLDRGLDVNSTREDAHNDYTALHGAANGEYVNVVQLLLDRGADWRLKNHRNSTAEDQTYSSGAPRELLANVRATQEAKDREAREAKDREAQEAKDREAQKAKAFQSQLLTNKTGDSTIMLTKVDEQFYVYLTHPDGSLTQYQKQ